MEGGLEEGGGAAPCVGACVVAEEGGDGGVEDGGESGGDGVFVGIGGDKPAVAGSCGGVLLVEGLGESGEPLVIGDGIGIGEHDDGVIGSEVFDA